MNGLAEAVNLRLHERDAGLKLQLHLAERETLTIHVHVIAVGTFGEPGDLGDARGLCRRAVATRARLSGGLKYSASACLTRE